jgi:ABC-type uncharacterized transport system permease subunit
MGTLYITYGDGEMSDALLLNLSALIALLPASLVAQRKLVAPNSSFWLLLSVAVAGPSLLLAANSADGWHSDLSTALWATITVSLLLLAIISAVIKKIWRLSALFIPYMFIFGLFATALATINTTHIIAPTNTISGWVALHIVVSITTYGLITLGSVAALTAILQERALKAKKQTPYLRTLPSLADCDSMVIRVLSLGEAVLTIGLLSGMALQISETGSLLSLNHKTVLTLTAFIVMGCLLFAHFKFGLRGRKAARLVLLGYLLLTLGYLGVKFVTGVLLAE